MMVKVNGYIHLFLGAVFVFEFCNAAGWLALNDDKRKYLENTRKVIVDEIRFGVCPHEDSAIVDSIARNDVHLTTNQVDRLQPTGAHIIETEKFHHKTKDAEKHDKPKNGRTNSKRALHKYECPKARTHDTELYRYRGDIFQNKGVTEETELSGEAKAKIIGGVSADVMSWPWQASIQYLGSEGDWHHFCGGSLVHTHWVVTAAHCVNELEDYFIRVVLGDYQLNKFSHREQVIDPARIFMHKYFNLTTFHYDIAMIKLTADAEINKYVKTVPVAIEDHGISQFDDNDICYITGWGNVIGSTTQDYHSDFLQQSRMWVMSQTQCSYNVEHIIADTQICVDSLESSACTGDSGGPLVCLRNDEWFLVGLTSFIVSSTCEPANPNVFTRVSNYAYWMAYVVAQYDSALLKEINVNKM